MKRRMEKRLDGDVTIVDDIAHSPEKAKSVLKNLRSIYSGKIIAVFEPNIGNRTEQSKPSYDNAFKDANEVIIPRLSKTKVDEKNPQMSFDGEELAQTIVKTHTKSMCIENDEKLVAYLKENVKKGDCVAFLGSHGFRGMIEDAVKKLASV